MHTGAAGESVMSRRISRKSNAGAVAAARSKSKPRATQARPWSLETPKPPSKPGPDAHAHKCPRDSYHQHAILQ